MNMFGIPMSGPTACGFAGATVDGELCGRWYQLASMLPLARNHVGDITNGDTQPYTLAQPYASWAKSALLTRLTYVRHIYTCLFAASQEGGSCVEPLLFHFPDDLYTFDPSNTENSFMLGDALKVAPVLQSKADARSDQMFRTYFPIGNWVDMSNYATIYGNQQRGQWLEIKAPEGETETIKTFLREGWMIPHQPQPTGAPFLTTSAIKGAPLDLVANPDPAGWAQGKIFMDEQDSVKDIEDGNYEYYQFHLSAGSLKKWNLNKNLGANSNSQGLNSLVITNAEIYSTSDYACWVDENDVVTPVTPTWDADMKTLTLKDANGPIDLFTLRNMYFGQEGKSQNLCYGIKDLEKQYYKTEDAEIPDLSMKGTTTIKLVNNSPDAHPELNLTLSVNVNGMANIQWTYTNESARNVGSLPYTIDTQIVDINTKPGQATLSSVFQWHQMTGPNKGEFRLMVGSTSKDNEFTPVFELKSNMMLNQYLNSWSGSAMTRPGEFTGVLGLPDQVSGDLILGDGTFSLWNREIDEPVERQDYPATNTYGSTPFIMGAASDSLWFGVYSNVAAAQDWKINNNEDTGEVRINFFATGGQGDISVMIAETANEVTQLFHTQIVGLPAPIPQWALGFHQSRTGY